ncbi:glycosyltransferase family 2 protein [Candidatus Thiothrix sp. Deng01]|uniref:Glycosyltransferase family 2 protein n=1 Tax=Candidatus Thiothrix phosphatis TaxID=3112415 RepID=A0ABU6D338_9GAMM|nr:glycosyltransferase family 2 protein [Candidatus Thiothrix sp. Deng01]MEB4593078.1 glycosyltransferase family 2 protein [Candidatus Thiothrix sp. Deng01]
MNSSLTPTSGLIPLIDACVVIVNFNAGGSILVDCIASVLACPSLKAIIVDNASRDDSLAIVEQTFTAHPRLRLIRNSTNLGFAAACNIGANVCQTDYLLFLNPDCRLEADTLPNLQTALASAPDVGMVGGLLLNPDGTEQAGGRRAIPTPWRTFIRAFGLSRLLPHYFRDYDLHLQPLPAEPVEVEAISGACMLVRHDVFEQLSGWDQNYFLHCEDLDICMRFRQGGWKILFVPTARVPHLKGVCSKSRPIFVEWHKHRGMMRFYRKFFRHQYPGALMWLVRLGVWLRFGGIALVYSLRQLRT